MTKNNPLPIVDVSSLLSPSGGASGSRRLLARQQAAAQAMAAACREAGFFYIVGHGVDLGLQERLEAVSRQFFRLDLASKMQIAMPKAEHAWRGYFPVGDELTSGKPDLKEGLYFGADLPPNHPDVTAQVPLHGANQYPPSLPAMRPIVLQYLAAMTELGHALMRGLSLSLGLDEGYFAAHFTTDPLTLFRIFHYPAPASGDASSSAWGVGEHTDYGVLTILKQDDCGGLEVKSPGGWIEAPPLANAFVCNIGDMLDLMTGGLYRSTPHRVRNTSAKSRLSWPFFFDPNFHAKVSPLPTPKQPCLAPKPGGERWDKANIYAFEGTYGDYLVGKVGKVFPSLKQKVLAKTPASGKDEKKD